MLVKAYTDKAFRELALCKSTLVASERSDFKILFLHSIYSIDDRFITYLLFPFYDNHRSKPFLAVIPWKSPEDRLNLSSEDKPDDQVKPLTPLTHPPPPKKKNSGRYSCDTTKLYLKCSRSIQPFCRWDRKGERKDIPSCSFSHLLIAYTRQLEITAYTYIHIFFTSVTHKFV